MSQDRHIKALQEERTGLRMQINRLQFELAQAFAHSKATCKCGNLDPEVAQDIVNEIMGRCLNEAKS